MVTVVPETVQTLRVELANVTVVPAESVAVPNKKVPALRVWEPGGVQLMVWLEPVIAILIGLPAVNR